MNAEDRELLDTITRGPPLPKAGHNGRDLHAAADEWEKLRDFRERCRRLSQEITAYKVDWADAKWFAENAQLVGDAGDALARQMDEVQEMIDDWHAR